MSGFMHRKYSPKTDNMTPIHTDNPTFLAKKIDKIGTKIDIHRSNESCFPCIGVDQTELLEGFCRNKTHSAEKRSPKKIFFGSVMNNATASLF